MTRPIHARAATLPDAFARAALAVIARAIDPNSMDGHEVREVRAHGRTPEDLLAHFLRECLYVHEVEGFGWQRVEFAVFDSVPRAGGEPLRLHAFLHGSTIDVDPNAPQDLVDLTRASVRVVREDGSYEVRIDPA